MGGLAAQIGAAQALGDGRGIEEVPFYEAGEATGDAFLVARDDRRVWDRQAEGAAEQGDDGEPVGDAAGETGLGDVAQQQRPEIRGGIKERRRE